MLRKKNKDPSKGKKKSSEIAADPSVASCFAEALIGGAIHCGAAHEVVGRWRAEVLDSGKQLGKWPVVFVIDPRDAHGAEYLKRTWGQSELDELLEEVGVTGERRIFMSVMDLELAGMRLPLEEMRDAISGDPPEGCSAWIFGVGGERCVLSALPESN